MTDEKVIELADKANMPYQGPQLHAFAQLVRNEVLAEAAVKCEEVDFGYSACEQFVSGEAAFECGKQIRSMK